MRKDIELKITPKILPIQILFSTFINLSTYSLIEFLKKEAEENPFLNFDFKENMFEEISEEVSIHESLIEQLNLLNIPEDIIEIGKFIIMNLEDNGYFKMSIEEVAEILNVKYKDVEKTLKIIQSLEPAGVAARNLQECFLIQARRYHKDGILIKIIENYWDLLTKRKFKEISEKMGVKEEIIEKTIIEKLKKLNPYPLNKKGKFIRRIIPEGRIEKNENKLKVYVEDKITPFIKIELDYERYIKSPFISEKERRFIENKIKKIKLIIKMIEKRRKFLEDVFQEIIEYQKDFFENGELLPLREKDIANKKNVSVSTINRAVNGKYLISPKGLLKIKDLFIPEFKHSISREYVMKKIKEIIEKEEKPLSDKKISEKLGYFGIKISPRTVNKYRNKMKILNSYLR